MGSVWQALKLANKSKKDLFIILGHLKTAWPDAANTPAAPHCIDLLRVILAGGRLKAMLSSQHRFHTSRLAPWLIFPCLLALVLLLDGCGMGGKNPAPMATVGFAFVTSSGSGSVSAFAMDSAGALSPVAGSPFPAGAGAEFLAFDSVHKFLFVSNQGANNILRYDERTG